LVYFLWTVYYERIYCRSSSYLNFTLFLLLLYWGYIVTFTKVITTDHSWIHHSIVLLSPSSPHSWNNFSRSHFFIYMIFLHWSTWYSLSYTLSLYPLPSHWYLPRQDLFCFPVPCFCKKKKMTFLFAKDRLFCLTFLWNTFIYIHMYIK
jgi:hypothetical protein